MPEHYIMQMSDLFLPHLRDICGDCLSEEQLLERIQGNAFVKVGQDLVVGKLPIGHAGRIQYVD